MKGGEGREGGGLFVSRHTSEQKKYYFLQNSSCFQGSLESGRIRDWLFKFFRSMTYKSWEEAISRETMYQGSTELAVHLPPPQLTVPKSCIHGAMSSSVPRVGRSVWTLPDQESVLSPKTFSGTLPIPVSFSLTLNPLATILFSLQWSWVTCGLLGIRTNTSCPSPFPQPEIWLETKSTVLGVCGWMTVMAPFPKSLSNSFPCWPEQSFLGQKPQDSSYGVIPSLCVLPYRDCFS